MIVSGDNKRILRLSRALLLAAVIGMFAVITLGSLLRVHASGSACPDWPTCLGSFSLPAADGPRLDYFHRLATFLAIPLVLAAAWLASRAWPAQPWVRRPAWLASGLLVGQVTLGALLSLDVLPAAGSGWPAVHLAFSLLILAALTAACAAAFFAYRSPAQRLHLTYRSPFSRLSLLTVALVFLVLITGAVVSSSPASDACPGWPLCGAQPMHLAAWINLIHRALVALAGGLVMALLLQAWRTQRSQTAVLASATAAAVIFFAQALLGARLVQGFPEYMLVLHSATAVAAWAALCVQAVAVGAAARTAEDERLETASWAGRKGVAKDLLLLTKPIVVLLLLVTTYAGMVIAAQAWPSLSLTFWTLLGGFMAAGGSGAINQYIDRYDDTKMQRTQKRPIPAGRMTPAEGLAFGIALCLASFYLMVAFVNLLAALLSLAGIIYYVLLYSVFLKKTTVQNIVIGGGAGAIPPLVGWAAAAGSLNVPSLFLFAVVFMWTPPHFWALALVRRKDYARAGVPMLPVVRGEAETQRQIFIYTLELVGLTLLLPLFGLGGAVYLLGAALLGLWLLHSAWKVWKEGGNKLAWKMYRYSSMYLAFLFVVLMIDRLL